MRTLDKFGTVWDNPIWDKCPTCGQPDNCGECNHKRLKMNDVIELGGNRPKMPPDVHYGIRLIV